MRLKAWSQFGAALAYIRSITRKQYFLYTRLHCPCGRACRRPPSAGAPSSLRRVRRGCGAGPGSRSMRATGNRLSGSGAQSGSRAPASSTSPLLLSSATAGAGPPRRQQERSPRKPCGKNEMVSQGKRRRIERGRPTVAQEHASGLLTSRCQRLRSHRGKIEEVEKSTRRPRYSKLDEGKASAMLDAVAAQWYVIAVVDSA